jgi:hypothetical protein
MLDALEAELAAVRPRLLATAPQLRGAKVLTESIYGVGPVTGHFLFPESCAAVLARAAERRAADDSMACTNLGRARGDGRDRRGPQSSTSVISCWPRAMPKMAITATASHATRPSARPAPGGGRAGRRGDALMEHGGSDPLVPGPRSSTRS